MKRIMGDDGILFLAHVHNACARHLAPGTPLELSDYLDFFGRENTRVFDEEVLFRTVMEGHEINLDSIVRPKEFEKIREINLVIGLKKGAGDVKGLRFKSLPPGVRLSLNPLYTVDRDDEKMFLRLRFPSKYFSSEYSMLVDYLPEHFQINLKEWQRMADSLTREKMAGEIKDYVKRGILVASPDAYFHPSWPSMSIPSTG